MAFNFFGRGPATQVEADHFVGSFVRFDACPQSDQQGGDDGEVHLHRHSRLAFADEVSAADVLSIIEVLRSMFAFVIIDTPAHLNDVVVSVLEESDEILMVYDDQAFGMVKDLAAKEGVLAGSSGGAMGRSPGTRRSSVLRKAGTTRPRGRRIRTSRSCNWDGNRA